MKLEVLNVCIDCTIWETIPDSESVPQGNN